MSIVVKCNYCNWEGNEPSFAECETEEEYREALQDFHDSHDNPERNNCPYSISESIDNRK